MTRTLLFILLLFSALPADWQKWYKNQQSYDSNPVLFLGQEWQIFLNHNREAERETINFPAAFRPDIFHIHLVKEFVVEDSVNGLNLQLHLPAISGYSEIRINDDLIHKHLDFPAPYTVELEASQLKFPGKNRIELVIRKAENPLEKFPDYVYLFRQHLPLSVNGLVWLEWLAPVNFSKVIHRLQGDQLTINYTINFINSDTMRNGAFRKVRTEERLSSPRGERIFNRFEYLDHRKGIRTVSRQIALKNPLFWQPSAPMQYQLKLQVYSESTILAAKTVFLGLRSLQTQYNKILLNGMEFRFKGITYRESTPASVKMIRNDLQLIKSMGFNAIRFPHRAPPQPVCYLADSLGLFICPENGIWRIPEEYFVQDRFLQSVKRVSNEILDELHQHPSLLGMGIGQELPVHLPAVQKYVLILNEFIKQRYDVLTYFSPLDYQSVPPANVTDFMMINAYNDAVYTVLKNYNRESTPVILGNVGFPAGSDLVQLYYEYFFSLFNQSDVFSGFFIESYLDWPGSVPSILTTGQRAGLPAYPYGLLDDARIARPAASIVKECLNSTPAQPVRDWKKEPGKTNAFSIAIFFASLLFFLIYRRNYRLRENVKRSFSHSYGFFVDLRDRRIIALFNSFIIGLFSNLLMTNIIAAFLYYYRHDIYIEEILSSVLVPVGMKTFYLALIQSPISLLLLLWGFFFSGQVLIAALLKILNLFSSERIRFRQTVAICNWAGLPLILLIPVSLLAYQIIAIPGALQYLFILMVLFFIWFNYRLATGIRVLMVIPAYKVFGILILTYSFVFVSLFVFLDSDVEFYGYLNLLTRAANLFY